MAAVHYLAVAACFSVDRVPHSGPYVSMCFELHKALGALGDYTKCLAGRLQARQCFQNWLADWHVS